MVAPLLRIARPDAAPARGVRATPSKLVCPACGGDSVGVLDSRLSPGSVRRRRHCALCAHRWNTYEVSEEVFLAGEELWRARARLIAARAAVDAALAAAIDEIEAHLISDREADDV